MTITFAKAKQILDNHGMEARPGNIEGRFEALCIFTDRSGAVHEEWESLPLTIAAIKDWLGY